MSKTNDKNIHDYWPFDYPERDNQTKALDWLAEQDAKYLILEAPVGSGKSNIGVTYSKYLGQRTNKGDSYILTPQRILQKQYEESFEGNPNVIVTCLYGKSNYPCASKNTTCDIGSILKPQCDSCPHKSAKQDAKLLPNTVMNYKLALSAFSFTTLFDPRKLMVCDEAHVLEAQLVDFDAVKVTEHFCKKHDIKFKTHKDLTSALAWLKDYFLGAITDKLKDMEAEVEPLMEKSGTDITSKEARRIREVHKFGEYVDEIHIMALRTEEYVENNFVLVNDPVMFTFKRLYGSYSFNKILKPKADKFLFMSSTILDKDGFCRDLGIPPEEAAFLSLSSDFPVENRQVYYMPRMKMNYSWNKPENAKGRHIMIDTINKLCEAHKNESGIIHTANFAVASWLLRELDIPHTIFEHSEEDRNTVIDMFIESEEPSVLISPSSTEGLDLKYDLGRFAIFTKVPYGFLGDQWIKKRMEISNEWYTRNAMINIIQGGGRIVRANDDTGVVYILDQSFDHLYRQTAIITPKWWREGFTRI